LSEPFVNPIDDEVLALIEQHGYEKAEELIMQRDVDKQRNTGVRLSPMNWIQYILQLQEEL
jgi:hypothetical protein